MKIIVEIENRNDFDHDNFMIWMRRWLRDINGVLGTNYWARFVGIEEEDDEND